MTILLWLVPAAVVTVAAMCVVAWVGRQEGREVDREVATRRLGEALKRPNPALQHPRPAVPRDRSTGIAVRPSRTPR